MKLQLPELNTRKKTRDVSSAQKVRSKRSSQLLTLLTFILVSGVLWLIQSMQSVYTTEVIFPIQYTGWPQSQTAEGTVPDKIVITLSDRGINLLNYSFLYSPDTVQLEINSQALSNNIISFSNAYLMEQVKKKLLSSSRVENILPESIKIPLFKQHSKKVPIRAIVEATPRNGFVALPPTVSPAEVTIYGSRKELQAIDEICTRPITFNNIDRDIQTIIYPELPSNMVSSPKSFTLTIQVEELTERTLDLSIATFGAPQGYVLRSLPSQASLRLTIPLSKYEELNRFQPLLYIDYSEADSLKRVGERADYLDVRIDGLPDWITVANVSPKQVQYILEPYQ